jgi:hypothetical protein
MDLNSTTYSVFEETIRENQKRQAKEDNVSVVARKTAKLITIGEAGAESGRKFN